ncbi:MAG: hypothetical protein KAU21_18520, partial [Gammaproteobacteria bacterium]|nr:hypothetical protein [Gammaproteobacteria bacterium]
NLLFVQALFIKVKQTSSLGCMEATANGLASIVCSVMAYRKSYTALTARHYGKKSFLAKSLVPGRYNKHTFSITGLDRHHVIAGVADVWPWHKTIPIC